MTFHFFFPPVCKFHRNKYKAVSFSAECILDLIVETPCIALLLINRGSFDSETTFTILPKLLCDNYCIANSLETCCYFFFFFFW